MVWRNIDLPTHTKPPKTLVWKYTCFNPLEFLIRYCKTAEKAGKTVLIPHKPKHAPALVVTQSNSLDFKIHKCITK